MATVPPLTFAALLKRHRRAAGLSQEALAERAGYSVSYISMLERAERTPLPATVELLAEALALSAEERAVFEVAGRRSAEKAALTKSLLAARDDEVAHDGASPAVQTFLITDVRGYTRFTVERGDEAAAALAMRFAALVRETVTPAGGRLLELRGDEALVVFGSARQALRVAVALQELFVSETQRTPEQPFPVGMGLDVGEAVPVEDGFRGAALNLAARLCSLAGPGEVLASEAVIHLARVVPELAYSERGAVQLKGFAEPVRVIQIQAAAGEVHSAQVEPGPREAAHSPAAPSDPVLPIGGFLGALPEGPLVAREAELQAVLGALDVAIGGSGRLVLLSGEPGVGKTRLAQEVTLEARNLGVLVAAGRCYEPQQSVAYYPFVEALAMLYAAAPAAMRAEVPHRWPMVARLLPDVSSSPAPAASPGGPDEQLRLFWQVTSFIQALAETRPVAVLLDDVQWADEGSLDLLGHLARHTRAARVFLLGEFRDVELGRQRVFRRTLRELEHEHLVQVVVVPRLTIEGTTALIAASLGAGEVPAVLAELVYRPAEGNPLFAQQMLRALVERGDIYVTDGQWQSRAVGEISVPESIRGTIGERVARLSEPAQGILREASVLGQVFPFDDLRGMSSRPEDEVDAALEEAIVAGLLREAGRSEYVFNHALTQRTLYLELTNRRRRRLHLLAGEAIELQPERKRERRQAELAWHFMEGDAVERALPYVLKAGDLAAAVYAHGEAERHYRTALELAREAGDAPREVEAQEKLGVLFDNLGRFDEAIEVLEQAVSGYRALGDRERLARATHRLARACHRSGKIAAGVGYLQALVMLLTGDETDGAEDRPPDLAGPRAARALDALAPAAAALIGGNMANYLTTLGRAEEALSVIEEAATRARRAGDVQIQVFVTCMRGNILRDLGRLDDAEQAWRASSELAREAGSLDFLAIALSNLGLAQVVHGDLMQARVLHIQALEVGTQLGDPYVVAWSRGDLAELAYIGGDWGQARSELASALEAVRLRPPGAARAAGLTYGAGMPLALLGRLDLAEGRSDEGRLALGEVLRLSARSTASGMLPWAQQAFAEHELLAGQPELARRRLEPLLEVDGSRESALPATLAWALLEVGEIERARQIVEATVAAARAERLGLVLLEALPVLARVALHAGRPVDAAQTADEALALARALPYPYAEAKALFTRGLVHAAEGETERAGACYTEALALLRQLGERPYAELIEHALHESEYVIVPSRQADRPS